MFTYTNSSDVISTTSTVVKKSVPTTEIGTWVREALESIPPQEGLLLNELGKALMVKFEVKDLHSAYLRIQTHFKAGRCVRKWGEHLIKVQDKMGYVVIFNTKPKSTKAVEAPKASQAQVDSDSAADMLADIGLA